MNKLLQVLLAMRANVEDRGMKGDCTPLMEAASAGHTEIVKLLLSHNAEVNAQSSSGTDISQILYIIYILSTFIILISKANNYNRMEPFFLIFS